MRGWLLLAVVVLLGYAGWASWMLARAPVKCDNRIANLTLQQTQGTLAEAEKDRQEAASAQQDVRDAGEQVRVEVREVFVPVKETVREIQTEYRCPGVFDDSVRRALDTAVDASNTGVGRLPAADD